MTSSTRTGLLDSLAIGAGTLCLIHCLLLPVLFLLLPALAAVLIVPEAFHSVALAFAVPTSTLALMAGVRRHRWTFPFFLVAPGLALMTMALLADESRETLLTVSGTVLLVTGHLLNWRALRRARGLAGRCGART